MHWAAGSVDYLMMGGRTVGGWLMGRSALAATAITDDSDFADAQISLARFFAEHELPKVGTGRHVIIEGSESTVALPVEML